MQLALLNGLGVDSATPPPVSPATTRMCFKLEYRSFHVLRVQTTSRTAFGAEVRPLAFSTQVVFCEFLAE